MAASDPISSLASWVEKAGGEVNVRLHGSGDLQQGLVASQTLQNKERLAAFPLATTCYKLPDLAKFGTHGAAATIMEDSLDPKHPQKVLLDALLAHQPAGGVAGGLYAFPESYLPLLQSPQLSKYIKDLQTKARRYWDKHCQDLEEKGFTFEQFTQLLHHVYRNDPVCGDYGFMYPDQSVLLFGKMLGVAVGKEEEGVDEEGLPKMCAIDRVGFDVTDPWALPEDEEFISKYQDNKVKLGEERKRLKQLQVVLEAADANLAKIAVAAADKEGELLAELHRWRKLRKAAVAQQLNVIKELLRDLKRGGTPEDAAAAAADVASATEADSQAAEEAANGQGEQAANKGKKEKQADAKAEKSKASKKTPAPAKKKERPSTPIHSEF
eukprot:gene9596-9759_t